MPYFHLVFTLSHDLNGLIGMAPRAIYETLFGAVSATLTEFAANPALAGRGRRPSPWCCTPGSRIWGGMSMSMRWWPAGRCLMPVSG
ncbi:hypothetical protein [Propionivibrio sp.]|uniref:hypothetical protein n=1 Tax=Propionivibrio sp. TaxID=2212460 RepID=UPI0025F43C0A|nr:hypothetical protein [Propionivibrio sp.]MBK7356387.1 hypothetical protein [Propionivibrio sp.]